MVVTLPSHPLRREAQFATKSGSFLGKILVKLLFLFRKFEWEKFKKKDQTCQMAVEDSDNTSEKWSDGTKQIVKPKDGQMGPCNLSIYII